MYSRLSVTPMSLSAFVVNFFVKMFLIVTSRSAWALGLVSRRRTVPPQPCDFQRFFPRGVSTVVEEQMHEHQLYT